MGHAVSYAYRLYATPEWEELFGPWAKDYDDDYVPAPFSARCIRHLPGWYAHKHPDEDFAETFAVWLTPGSAWRDRMPQGLVRRKLEYIDRVMHEIADQPPVIDPESVIPDPDELNFTVGQFYRDRAIADAPPVHDLRSMFTADGLGMDGSTLIHDRRKVIMRSVSGFTGSRLYVAKVLIDTLARRVRELNLRAAHGKEIDAIIGVTALASTLTRNFLQYKTFVPA
jgi:hypothetical protein